MRVLIETSRYAPDTFLPNSKSFTLPAHVTTPVFAQELLFADKEVILMLTDHEDVLD